MNGILRVVRNGEVKLTIPGPSVVFKNGQIWTKTGLPLLNGDHVTPEIKAIADKKDFAKIPAQAFMYLGDNGNGAWVGTDDEWQKHPAKIAQDEKDRIKAIEKAEIEKKTKKIYLSSRGWGDYSPVEWIGDITRPTLEILAECRDALKKGYDVDTPNKPDAEIIKDIEDAKNNYNNPPAPIIEPKHGPGYCYNCETYCYGDCGEYAPQPTRKSEMRKIREMMIEANYGIND